MLRRSFFLPVIALAIASALAAPALAGGTADTCFYARDWQSWKSPAPNQILLRVGVKDIYRLDLRQGSDMLNDPDVHLVNRHQTTAWLCEPTDFDLLVSEGHGIASEPLFVARITKLTPEEIAAIPPKDRP